MHGGESMDENYIRQRITELRLQKGVSEYRMSTDMGHSKGYIQHISTGRCLPSMSEFLYMCGYFGITPNQFFDDGAENPVLLNEAVALMSGMDDDDLKAVIGLLQRFKTEHK